MVAIGYANCNLFFDFKLKNYERIRKYCRFYLKNHQNEENRKELIFIAFKFVSK